MEIHFQTTDHVVAVEIVAEQHVGTKLLGKSAITHSKVGQSSPNLFPLSIGYSCTTLWVKNSLEIALSLRICQIFLIFDIFSKSSNKVAITHLYIEQQV